MLLQNQRCTVLTVFSVVTVFGLMMEVWINGYIFSGKNKILNNKANMTTETSERRPSTGHTNLAIIPEVKVSSINCAKIISGNNEELKRAEILHKSYKKTSISPSHFLEMVQDCGRFIKSRQYTVYPLSSKSELFPLAFGLLVYKDIEQVERLLRAIYRPQNYYCIHVDLKAPSLFRKAVEGLARCFDNVHLASVSIDVRWGAYSLLDADLTCMEDLWKFKSWKYFINLAGQEFPLQTNEELVQILNVLNSSTIAVLGRLKKDRVEKANRHPPPGGIHLVKGSMHVVAPRGFVDFVMHNQTALAFRDWVKDTIIPDETFFPTLAHNPHLNIPGTYLHSGKKNIHGYPYLGRYVNWRKVKCHGKFVRSVCVFGVGDLKSLASKQELFLNKFHLKYQPLAYDCFEELHYNKTRDVVRGNRKIDLSFYANLDMVKNHI